MEFIAKIVDSILINTIGMDPSSKLTESISYFITDSIGIIGLLFVMIAAIGFARSFLPQKKVKAWLNNMNEIAGNTTASVFGTLTPFCSCSSIPLFISFIKTGIPIGTAFAFLITSPLVNEYLLILMVKYFNLKIAVLYAVAGITIGVVSGMIIKRLKIEKFISKDFTNGKEIKDTKFNSLIDRINYGIDEAKTTVKKLWAWILLGVSVGAIIHNYVPQEFIDTAVAKAGIFGVPIVVMLGIPMYGSCAAIVPIAVALFDKGVPLGTALAFMMAVSALSLPEAIILRRAMRIELIALFFGIVALGIVLIGYLFNFLQLFL